MNTAITTSRENRIRASIGYLHIDDAGTGGIPVVFAHSFGGTLHNWAAQLEHLRVNRRAIAFDLRGHGLSDAPSDNNYDVALLAEDIATIADSLELEKFMLGGHSMGGSAVIAYAGLHPEKVAGLMMV
ncbi:MAG TPA: alpha/beta fold hydrolase, partial [Chitinophagaceae bacterium]